MTESRELRVFLLPEDAMTKIRSGEMSDELLVDAGRVYWNGAMEEAAIESIRRQLLGFEFGRLPDDRTVYARWRNGPDLYEHNDRPLRWGPDQPSLRETLVHVLDCWTKIPKKSNTDSPRRPADVPALLAALPVAGGDRNHNFLHAANGLRDGLYPPFVQMFEQDPELHYDCVRHVRRAWYGL